jgi:hypothetical protein
MLLASPVSLWHAVAVIWRAYADEAMRTLLGGYGAYLFVAACVEDSEQERARHEMASLAAAGKRFHWRTESEPMRRKALTVVAGLPALHLVIVGAPLDFRRQERARRFCLQRLLHELDEAGVSEVWLESRTQSLNQRDVGAINAFRGRRELTANIFVGHGRPLEEPLLWVPDIVAGAVGEAVRGDDSYQRTISSLITRYDITLG